MTRIVDLNSAIKQLFTDGADSLTRRQKRAVKALLTRLGALNAEADLEIALGNMFATLEAAPQPNPVSSDQRAFGMVEKLRTVAADDLAFAKAIDALRSDRKATKPLLIETYRLLFDRQQGIRATATRDEILDVIAGERYSYAKHGMLGLITRPTVAAE